MVSQFLTIGVLTLFSAMLPGPDFALVTKNTILHSRRSGMLTSAGICSAILIHISYCVLGLGIVIANSVYLFNIIKYIGAVYLIYLGIQSLLAKVTPNTAVEGNVISSTLSDLVSFRQGFLCNLLNPKATLFFLALFTMILKPDTPGRWMFLYVLEVLVIVFLWFSSLTFLLSHPAIMRLLNNSEKYIAKLLGCFLIVFGVILAFL